MAKLRAQLTFRVPEEVYDQLQEISGVEVENRKMNEVARALLDRGLAAYRRDGKLFEPKAEGGKGAADTGAPYPGPTISVPTITLGQKEKKKRA